MKYIKSLILFILSFIVTAIVGQYFHINSAIAYAGLLFLVFIILVGLFGKSIEK